MSQHRQRFVPPLLALLLAVSAAPAGAVSRAEVFPEGQSVCAGTHHGERVEASTPSLRSAPRDVAVPPGEDLVTLQWAGVQADPVSDEIPIEIRSGTVGLAIHAYAPSNECLISVELLGPDGELLACYDCPDAPAVGNADTGFGTVQMPSTDRPGWRLVPGSYSFRVRAIPIEDGPPCDGATVEVLAFLRSGEVLHVERTLDLNFVYLPNSTLSSDIAQSSPLFAQLLEAIDKGIKWTGIRLGNVTHVDLDRPEFDVIATWEEVGEMFRTSAEVGRPRALNVYCVKGFEEPLYPAVGLSGGIPGPAINGRPDSGVAIRMEPFFLCSDCLRAYGSLFAHEIGHYVGFYHTTEANLATWDPFSDTPECHGEELRSCPDWNHVMFPVIHPANTVWSPAQARVAQTHALVRTVVTAGVEPVVREVPPDPEAPLVRIGPSPFDSETRIALAKGSGSLTVDVHDVSGRRIRRLQGRTEVVWDGRAENGTSVPAGVYFLRANAADGAETRRVVKTR